MRRSIALILMICTVAVSFGWAADPAAAQGEPRIAQFNAALTSISRAQLNDGSVRVPVQWAAVNRPVFATLIFEQILPDGRVVNVELPRSTPWVNSSGTGIVAPQPVGNASEVVLRVRLYSYWLARQYDERRIVIPVIDTTVPTVIRFDTPVISVVRADLALRGAYVGVNFAVANRTSNHNLVFEQVMPDGRLLNVELPRTNIIIPSSGEGVVRPYDPGTAATALRFRLTIYDLRNGARLANSELTVPITEPSTGSGTITVVTGEACFATPFATSQFLVAGQSLQVTNSNGSLQVRSTPGPSGAVFAIANDNDVVQLIEGPYCYYYDGAVPAQTVREWRVRNLTQSYGDGWVREYTGNRTAFVPTLVPYTAPNPGTFTAASQTTVEGGNISLSWNVPAASGLQILLDFPDLGNAGAIITGNIQPNVMSGYSTNVPRGLTSVRYTLLGTNGLPLTPNLSVTISVTCTNTSLANTFPQFCPNDPARSVTAAYQSFERGFMIWYESNIFVFYNNGTAVAYADTYTEADEATIRASAEGVAANLFVPVRGFGKVWATYPEVRSGLGWATAPEQGYTASVQNIVLNLVNSQYIYRLFVTRPNGTVVSVANTSGGSSYTWQ